MGLRINNRARATGRAKCNTCGQPIKKGILCVSVVGWHTLAYSHIKCPRRDYDV